MADDDSNFDKYLDSEPDLFKFCDGKPSQD